MVDDGPEESEAFYFIDKLVECDGLGDVGIDAEFVAAKQIAFFLRSGEHDDGNLLHLGVGLEFFEDFHSIDLGQL